MKEFARFVTLAPEERARLGLTEPGTPGSQGRGSTLLKSHRFAVTYPDGSTGECRYTRFGLKCHQFRFFDSEGKELPCRQYVSTFLNGGAPAVEEAGHGRVERAYMEAIKHERVFTFARVSPPSDGSRSINPERYRMTAGKAKTLGGKYALCVRIGCHLVAQSHPFETLEEANDAWRTCATKNALFVACCNRLDRCRELPRYNPLYASGHPGKESDHA